MVGSLGDVVTVEFKFFDPSLSEGSNRYSLFSQTTGPWRASLSVEFMFVWPGEAPFSQFR